MKPTIKDFRTRKKLRQVDMAKAAGITVTNYQRIEYGTQRPSLDTAIRIADALGVQDLRELWTVKNIVTQPNG